MSNEDIVEELKQIEFDGDLGQILGPDLMARLYSALTQQSESQEAAAFTGSGSLAAIKAGKEGYIWGAPAKAHPVALYLDPQPSAQVPEGWKLVPNTDTDQWLENISKHGLPTGPHSFILRTILNLAPAAPSIAEKREWIQSAPKNQGDGGILHIPLKAYPDYMMIGFLTDNDRLVDMCGDDIGYQPQDVEKWMPMPTIQHPEPPEENQ